MSNVRKRTRWKRRKQQNKTNNEQVSKQSDEGAVIFTSILVYIHIFWLFVVVVLFLVTPNLFEWTCRDKRTKYIYIKRVFIWYARALQLTLFIQNIDKEHREQTTMISFDFTSTIFFLSVQSYFYFSFIITSSVFGTSYSFARDRFGMYFFFFISITRDDNTKPMTIDENAFTIFRRSITWCLYMADYVITAWFHQFTCRNDVQKKRIERKKNL